MKIRRAELLDVDQLVGLFDAYRQFYGRASDVDGARRFMTERLQKSDSTVFVVEDGRRCVGFTQLFPSWSAVGLKRIWILNDLFVMPEYRRRGAASLLVRTAVEFAGRDGASRLDLATAADNAAAQALYESLGWKLESTFTHYKFLL